MTLLLIYNILHACGSLVAVKIGNNHVQTEFLGLCSVKILEMSTQMCLQTTKINVISILKG